MSAELFPIGKAQRTCDRCGEPDTPKEMKYIPGGFFLCRLCQLDLQHWMKKAQLERSPEAERIIRSKFERFEESLERKETK